MITSRLICSVAAGTHLFIALPPSPAPTVANAVNYAIALMWSLLALSPEKAK